MDYLIAHYPHHKCGTVWFNSIFEGLSKKFGWKYQHCPPKKLERDTILWTVAAEPDPFDFRDLGRQYRASHMIRDPRDLIISGYNYHLICKEAHILENGYQEKLKSLDRDEGILLDLKRNAANSTTIMYYWYYENPNVFEFKYEDIWGNDEYWFRKIFKHYGFSEYQTEVGLEVVRENTFEKAKHKGHAKKGTPGQWKGVFNKKVKIAIIGSVFQAALEKLGYEKDASWAFPL